MNKIALVTTTIRVPHVLSFYRAAGKDVHFFIAGDKKTPDEPVTELAAQLGEATYLSVKDQERLGYRCSEVIGWNSIQRRNIALLEAIKSGAEIIVSVDDDNMPLNVRYFSDFANILESEYDGLVAASTNGWFNVGQFLCPPVYHRGFPYELMAMPQEQEMYPVCGMRVGVAAGLWLGDPDIPAVERITKRQRVHDVSQVLRKGFVVSSNCLAPFDSQNTACIRQLAPLMMVLCGVGRYDDIWASYVAQRVMMETGHCVHFGRPLVWQSRNPHNLLTDLKNEIFGMEHTMRFCNDLMTAELGKGTALDKLFRIYNHLEHSEYLPPIVSQLGRAWCEDIEDILS